MTEVRIQRPAAACMFKSNPRGRVFGAPEGERAPRDRRCRADRAFGANPFVLIVGLTAVSADSRGEAAPPPRRRFAPEVWDMPEDVPPGEGGQGKGVSQKFLTKVRIQRPLAACIFKANPRGRVLVRPRASALPGTVAAAPIARSAQTLSFSLEGREGGQ